MPIISGHSKISGHALQLLVAFFERPVLDARFITRGSGSPGTCSPATRRQFSSMASRDPTRGDTAFQVTGSRPHALAKASGETRRESSDVVGVQGVAPHDAAPLPLRDRTNTRDDGHHEPCDDAVTEFSDDDVVSDSAEEETEATGPGPKSSPRPFGVPVGVTNEMVEQMMRRGVLRAPLDEERLVRVTLTQTERETASAWGRHEPSPNGESPNHSIGEDLTRDEPISKEPLPHNDQAKRRRKRRRSPPSRSAGESEKEEEDEKNTKDHLRNNGHETFEVDDDLRGDVSEHSDASHDRTAGVRGFNFGKLAGDAYGKGRRRRVDAGRNVADVLSRRQRSLDDWEGFSDDSSTSSSDSDDEVARPTNVPTTRPYREYRASPFPATNETRAETRQPQIRREYVDLVGTEPVTRTTSTRTESVAVLDATTRSSLPDTAPPAATRTRAPWSFPLDVAPFDLTTLRNARLAASLERLNAHTSTDPETSVRVAVALFVAGSSVSTRREQKEMSAIDLSKWLIAITKCENSVRDVSGTFWRTLGVVLVDLRVEETFESCESVEENRAERRAESVETSWEVLFAAARVWRAWVQRDEMELTLNSVPTRLNARTDIQSEHTSAEKTSNDEWANSAWAVVLCALAVSPVSRGDKSYAAQIARRVEALVRAWPRCTSASGPAWELWRQCSGLGKAPSGTALGVGANEADKTVRGEYPAAAAFAARAAAAAAEGPGRVFLVETNAHAITNEQARPSCCAMPPPFAFSNGTDTTECVGLVSPHPTVCSACPTALQALMTHIGKSTDPRDLRRDLGRVLSAASFPKDEFEFGKTTTHIIAFGGSSFQCTSRGEKTRHRAATHAQLGTSFPITTHRLPDCPYSYQKGAFPLTVCPYIAMYNTDAFFYQSPVKLCLTKGMADQAAACLRQLRGALLPGRTPNFTKDPAPLLCVCRALGNAASAWLVTARSLGKEAFAKLKGFHGLVKEGELTMDALFEAACGDRNLETAAATASTSVTSGNGVQPGSNDALATGAVCAEAAHAAASMYAALVASGAHQVGAEATQNRFEKYMDDVTWGSAYQSAWPKRVFTQRALAALLVPNTFVSQETHCAATAESLVPVLAYFARSTATDVVVGGVGPLAAALFVNPLLPLLNEGVAVGTAGAADAVARLQRNFPVFVFPEDGADDRETATARALRGGETCGGANAGITAACFFGGVAAAQAETRRKELRAAACVGGTPGDALGEPEARFRTSAGSMAGAQLAACGAAGTWAIAKLARLLSSLVPHRPLTTRREGGDLVVCSPRAVDTGGALCTNSRENNARARCVAVAGATEWLLRVSERTVGTWPVASDTASPFGPVFATLAGLAGGIAFDSGLLHGDHLETVCVYANAISSAAKRWDAVSRRTDDRDSREFDHENLPGWGGENASVAVTDATRDLCACTVGVLEWTLGVEDGDDRDGKATSVASSISGTSREDQVLDALAAALVGEDFPGNDGKDERDSSRASSSESASSFVLSRLVPNFLATETHNAPQIRCARVWLSVLALCARLLAREDDRAAADTTDFAPNRSGNEVSQDATRAFSLFANTIATPGVVLLSAVVNEGGGGVNHQACVAVVELFHMLTSRIDVASGTRAVFAATATATATAPLGQPAPAPAPAQGYFPFPGTVAATAAAVARSAAREREGTYCISQTRRLFANTRLTLSFIYRKLRSRSRRRRSRLTYGASVPPRANTWRDARKPTCSLTAKWFYRSSEPLKHRSPRRRRRACFARPSPSPSPRSARSGVAVFLSLRATPSFRCLAPESKLETQTTRENSRKNSRSTAKPVPARLTETASPSRLWRGTPPGSTLKTAPTPKVRPRISQIPPPCFADSRVITHTHYERLTISFIYRKLCARSRRARRVPVSARTERWRRRGGDSGRCPEGRTAFRKNGRRCPLRRARRAWRRVPRRC